MTRSTVAIPMGVRPASIEDYYSSDPFARFYNLTGLSDVFLTCDVDWAPEYAIETVLRAVEQNGLKLTIFATHRSALLDSAPDWLEVGLHPDFTRKNTNGHFEERFQAIQALYPGAVGMRSHRDFFGNNIGDLATRGGLRYDASSFLWNQPFCSAHVDYNGMTRFSYMWEDGIHLDMKMPLNWDGIALNTPGLKILNVHPVLIYLNCVTDDQRRAVTRRYTDLTTAPLNELEPCVNRERGIGDLWREMLRWLAESGVRSHCLRDALP